MSKPSSPRLAGAGSPKLAAHGSPKLATAGSPKILAAGSPKLSPKLAPAKAEAAPLKPATASRDDNLQYDLKHLAAFDITPLNAKTKLEEYTRDSVQLLINKIYALPKGKTEDGFTVELPDTDIFRLPRMRPLPKVKATTRWEKFAQEKGIEKRKRSKLVFDENTGDWLPRWGYKSAKFQAEKGNVVHEVKEGDNPMENPFDKGRAEKKLLQARQKMREVRNKVEGAGGKMAAQVPALGIGRKNVNPALPRRLQGKAASMGIEKRGKDGLKEAVRNAQASSASMGKFDRVAPNENTTVMKKKRKLSFASTSAEEKERYLKTATRVFSGEGNVDKAKAAKMANTVAGGGTHVSKGKGKGPKRRSKCGGRKGKKGNNKR